MRNDLNKLLCERERHGHDRGYSEVRHNKKLRPDDEVGGREGIKRRYQVSGNNKEFNENLTPLWGLIRANVNRPWDKVYSELCSVFDKRRVVNQHILTHLFQAVAVKTAEKDGEVWIMRDYGGPERLRDSYQEYYVHPRTGLLLKNKYYKGYKQKHREQTAKRKAEDAKVRRVIDDQTELRLINGVWFVVSMKECSHEPVEQRFETPLYMQALGKPHVKRVVKVYPSYYDVVKQQMVSYPTAKYADSKRTASHKELKKYGIVE